MMKRMSGKTKSRTRIVFWIGLGAAFLIAGASLIMRDNALYRNPLEGNRWHERAEMTLYIVMEIPPALEKFHSEKGFYPDRVSLLTTPLSYLEAQYAKDYIKIIQSANGEWILFAAPRRPTASRLDSISERNYSLHLFDPTNGIDSPGGWAFTKAEYLANGHL